LPVKPKELLIREMILQLKTGYLDGGYFQAKFGVDILREFGDGFNKLAGSGDLIIHDGAIEMTRPGLLHVDRLLPDFFMPEHKGSRYT
jgi:oxygen-independent coproporphyrinogen-3 oxidase